MEKPYRAAIVGLGNIAWRFDHETDQNDSLLTHMSAYEANKHTLLVGACAADKKDQSDFYNKLRIPIFDSVEEMVQKTAPEIVSICSPTEYHFQHATYCMEQNIPMIWLEKPPASAISELHQLQKKERETRSHVLVNYMRRYAESYQSIQEIYKKKQLGECKLIQMNYSKGLETNGSHIIDLLFFIVGDEISYNLEWVSDVGSTENPCFSFSIENKLGVIVSGSDLPYHNVDISLTCDRGRASVLHGGMDLVIEKKNEHELFPGFFRLTEEQNKYLSSSAFKYTMTSALGDLILSHQNDSKPTSSLDSAANTLILIEKVKQWQREKK
jgi:predicted dehydrogenase